MTHVRGANVSARLKGNGSDWLEIFHLVNSLLPDNQEVLTVSPDMPAREALNIMREHAYSQLPTWAFGSCLTGWLAPGAGPPEIDTVNDGG